MTREALDAMAHRYFQTLTDHKPVVADYDEARCTLPMYSNQVTYVSEVFTLEAGRITHIDNIGLVKPGLEHTTGFGTHK